MEVHDRDLEEWALVAAEKLKLPKFKASHHWIDLFKRRNKIVFRTRTRLVGRKRKHEEGVIARAVDNFMEDVQKLLEGEQAIHREKVF